MNKPDEYPQMSRMEAVLHCKKWANEIRIEGVDALVKDYDLAVSISDQLAYPLDMQPWITPVSEPELYEVQQYAATVDSDHTNRATWETLLVLIDHLYTVAT